MRSRAVAGVVVTLAVALTLTACQSGSAGQGGSNLSRVRLYSSIKAMAADSEVVLVGDVASSAVAYDIVGDPNAAITISSVIVQRVVRGGGASGIAAGDTVRVRQFGSTNQRVPVPLLASGRQYLLFLTKSGLPGDLASQFYVTGSNAGLYARSASSGTADPMLAAFDRVDPEPGESLPATLQPTDARF